MWPGHRTGIAQNTPPPQTSGRLPASHPHHQRLQAVRCLLQCWARLQSLVLTPPGMHKSSCERAPHPLTCSPHHLPGGHCLKPSPLTLAHPPLSSTFCCLLPHPPHMPSEQPEESVFPPLPCWPRSDHQSCWGPAYTSQYCQFFSLSASLAHEPFCSVRGSLLRTG